MDNKYRKLIENITLENEKYTEKEMKAFYKALKDELSSINTMLGDMFIKYGVIGSLKMTTSQKADMDVKTLLKNLTKRLGNMEVEKVSSILSDTYLNTYYKTAFINDMGIKTTLKFDIAKKEFIDAAMNAKIDGEMFSDRIWNNKVLLADNVQGYLVNAMNGKLTLDQVAKSIRETFNTSAYNSKRLVNTENAKMQSQASIDIANNLGIEKHMWSATLDNKTSTEDADRDGILFDVNDTVNVIPSKPNCRCAWINVPYENWSPTNRRDNMTKEVIDYTDYKAWAKEKGIS